MPEGEWPLDVDGKEYQPIPESWIGDGYDKGTGHVRIYAVSAALLDGGKWLYVRYTRPKTSQTATYKTSAVAVEDEYDGIDGRMPGALSRNSRAKGWPRSMVPTKDPDDVRRLPEDRHMRRLWGDRVDDVPSDDDLADLIADGGSRIFADVGECMTDIERGDYRRCVLDGVSHRERAAERDVEAATITANVKRARRRIRDDTERQGDSP